MAFLGRRPGDITIHGINDGDQFSLRWHRLLLPFEGMPAVHFGPLQLGPATTANPAQAADGHFKLSLPAPIDVDTPVPDDQECAGLVPAANPGGATPAPQIEDAAGPSGDQALFGHPPYFFPAPLADGDTVASDAGGKDLGAAFLPPDSDDLADLPHGLDAGLALTPPPLPPPPEMI